MKKLNMKQGNHRKVVSDKFEIPVYDCVQEQEDDWISSVLGSESDTLDTLF